MKLIYEDAGVVVDNDGQRIITIDYFFQLNYKYVEGLCRVLQRPGGNTGWVSNTGVALSAMTEANLQGMIYHIKNSNRIGGTCTHADVELAKFHAIYHRKYMEESHKDPEAVPTVDPKYWPKTLETVE